MGQWRKNLNSKSRRNSRKPKSPEAAETIESLPSVDGVKCGGCAGEVKLLADVIRIGEGMSVSLVETAKANAEAGIKTEFVGAEQPSKENI